ncbi:MAG: hypothetical protein WAV23_00815 [Minisyncoccia bacterium]
MKKYHFKHHFRDEETAGAFRSFAKQLLKIRKQIQHYRKDKLKRKEIFNLACSHKELGNLFERKLNDDSINIAKELSPVFTSEFNGVIVKVVKSSTLKSIERQYIRIVNERTFLDKDSQEPTKFNKKENNTRPLKDVLIFPVRTMEDILKKKKRRYPKR